MSPTPRHTRDEAVEAADFLRRHLKGAPRAAIVTGTGLGDVTSSLQVETTFDYQQIPHFPLSTVQTHSGRLLAGSLAGRRVVVLQGRFHLYEGYSARAVAFPIRVLQHLGATVLILTNASGGLNPSFEAGDIMLIADHVNLTGANPLVGANEDQWGPRFPDMTDAYSARLRALASAVAGRLGLCLHTGVYVGLTGPSLETPAEMRFLRSMGADAVGLSTVMETIAAVHAGIQVLGLSTITNICSPDAPRPASVEAIIEVAQGAAPRLAKLIAGVLAELEETPGP